jgi:hypothetical protein
VAIARPILKGPYKSGELSKESFTLIMKKTAEKVVAGYRKEGMRPPTAETITPSQQSKIEKLAQEYVKIYSKGGDA